MFVLGEPPRVPNPGRKNESQYIEDTLDAINGRVVLYDQLITNALSQYEEYLQATSDARELDALLGTLDGLGGD